MSARRGEAGAAAVEAALVICFIVLPLTFGAISYGFMLSFRQSVSQAASEGARAAAVAPSVPVDDADDQASKNRDAVQAAIDDALANGVKCDLATEKLTRGSNPDVGTCKLETSDGVATVSLDFNYADYGLVRLPLVEEFLPDHLAYSSSVQVSQ